VPLQVLNREYKTQLVNGEDFTINPSDSTDFLLADVPERVKYSSTVRVSWFSQASGFQIFEATDVGGVGRILTRTSGSWIDEGWRIGDSFYYEIPNSTPPIAPGTGNVIYVDQTTIEVDTTLGLSPATQQLNTIRLSGTTPLTGLLYSYGLIEIQEAFNTLSKIDGSPQEFRADGVGADLGGGIRDTAPVLMQPYGSVKSWQNGSATIQYVQSLSNDTIQEFLIEHEFITLPFWLAGQDSNLDNATPPAPTLDGSNSLQYVSDFEFRRGLNDPNSPIGGQDNILNGNVGYYNEKFNGGTAEYSLIGSISYTDVLSATSVTGLQKGAQTQIDFTVSSTAGTFNGPSGFVIGISKLPTVEEYQPALNGNPATEDFETIWIFETAYNTVNGLPVSNGIFTDFDIVLVNANEVNVTARIDFSLAQQSKIEPDSQYAIWVITQDYQKGNFDSDRVSVIVDRNEYVASADVPGLVTIDEDSSGFYAHWQNITIGNVPFTDYKGWDEDGFPYTLMILLDETQNANLEAITGRVVGFNDNTEEIFDLDSYSVNLATSVQVSGVNQYNIQIDRNFNLDTNDPFRKVVLVNWPPLTLPGTTQAYRLILPFKWRFEDYIANSQVNQVFYDSGEPNNNLNFKSSNYSATNGGAFNYSTRVVVDLDVSNGASVTTYRVISPECEIYNYRDDNGLNEWTDQLTLTDSSSVNIGNSILTNGLTTVEFVFTRTSGTLDQLEDYVGIIRLYSTNGTYTQIQEISTEPIHPVPSTNALIPLPGDTQLFRIKDDPSLTVTLRCNIDPSLLPPGNQFYLTGALKNQKT